MDSEGALVADGGHVEVLDEREGVVPDELEHVHVPGPAGRKTSVQRLPAANECGAAQRIRNDKVSQEPYVSIAQVLSQGFIKSDRNFS